MTVANGPLKRMDDMLNTIDTCRGCGDDAERAKMRVGMGECCAPSGRNLALSERYSVPSVTPWLTYAGTIYKMRRALV